MKFTQRDQRGNEVTVIVLWGEHAQQCKACSAVNIADPKTLSAACWLGSKLAAEELAIRAAPTEKAKARAIEEWAEKAGTFITRRGRKTPTPYAGG